MPREIQVTVAAVLFAAAFVVLVWRPKPVTERIPFLQRIPNLKEIRREVRDDTRRTSGFIGELADLKQIVYAAFSPATRIRFQPLPRLFRDPSELEPHEKLQSREARAAMLRTLADPCDLCGDVDCIGYECQEPKTGVIVQAPEPIRVLAGIWDDYKPDMSEVTRIQAAYAELEAGMVGYSD